MKFPFHRAHRKPKRFYDGLIIQAVQIAQPADLTLIFLQSLHPVEQLGFFLKLPARLDPVILAEGFDDCLALARVLQKAVAGNLEEPASETGGIAHIAGTAIDGEKNVLNQFLGRRRVLPANDEVAVERRVQPLKERSKSILGRIFEKSADGVVYRDVPELCQRSPPDLLYILIRR